jgi:hypothetical protein
MLGWNRLVIECMLWIAVAAVKVVRLGGMKTPISGARNSRGCFRPWTDLIPWTLPFRKLSRVVVVVVVAVVWW